MWNLAPWPGIQPCSPALRVQGLSHWTIREVPELLPVSSCLCSRQPGWWLRLPLYCNGFVCVSVPRQLFEARNMSHHLSGPRTKHGNFQAYLRVDFFFQKILYCSDNTVQTVLPAVRETQVWSVGGDDPLEESLATHSSILAWRIPWTEEPGGLHSPWVWKESNTTEQLTLSLSV